MCTTSPVIKQFLAATWCNLLTLSFGISSGWATINLLELQNESTTFPGGPLNQQQTSTVMSIMFVGAFTGNIILLPIGQVIGVKRTIHLFSIPIILGSILTIVATNVYYLYVSRFLIGLVGGGVGVAVPAFILDIANDNVRGALNAMWDPFNNSGIIISYVIGNCLSFVDQAKVQLIPPIVFMIAAFFLPESPEFWTRKNNEKRAIESRRFYKGTTMSEHDGLAFHRVPQNETDEMIENAFEMNVNDEKGADTTPGSEWFRDFCTPHAKNALFISFTAVTLSFLSGAFTIVGFVTQIFNETGSSFSEKHSSILVSITSLTGNLMFLNIVERVSRRTLYIASSVLTMFSYFLFSAYGYLWLKQPGMEWMPTFCFVAVVYSSCMGLSPIPFIMSFELFPKKIRQTCLTAAISIFWIVLFVLGATFYTFIDSFGLFNCMIVLGFMCSLNAMFGFFFLPETRGKSFEEIEAMMTR